MPPLPSSLFPGTCIPLYSIWSPLKYQLTREAASARCVSVIPQLLYLHCIFLPDICYQLSLYSDLLFLVTVCFSGHWCSFQLIPSPVPGLVPGPQGVSLKSSEHQGGRGCEPSLHPLSGRGSLEREGRGGTAFHVRRSS